MKKIPDFSGLATKTALTGVENKIPDISNFATNAALTNLSNTVPDINTFIKKSNYDTKIAEIESNIKNYKHLIRANLDVKVILKKMVDKII